MAGIARDKRRVKELSEVEVLTPFGGKVTVTQTRAQQLLDRGPIAFGDGKWRQYVIADSGDDIEVDITSKARAPRKGTGVNSPEVK